MINNTILCERKFTTLKYHQIPCGVDAWLTRTQQIKHHCQHQQIQTLFMTSHSPYDAMWFVQPSYVKSYYVALYNQVQLEKQRLQSDQKVLNRSKPFDLNFRLAPRFVL